VEDRVAHRLIPVAAPVVRHFECVGRAGNDHLAVQILRVFRDRRGEASARGPRWPIAARLLSAASPAFGGRRR
jgi:hypothetical protein